MLKKCNKKLSSFFLCLVLVIAMALFTTACSDDKETPTTSIVANDETTTTGEEANDTTASTTASEDNNDTEANVLGEGNTKFSFTVVDKDGNETEFEIHTDKETVGEALVELELIEGEDSEYGLYVKTVNGITADYDIDGTYWAFYINGEYAQTGVDSTNITEGDSYSFKVE